jgi:two-component system, OmpR family, response regulator
MTSGDPIPVTNLGIPASRQSPLAPVVPRRHLDGRQPRVLIVDAERVVAEMSSIALNGDGIQTVTAPDGASALAMARSFDPDLVVLDQRLPDTDANTLVCRLRDWRPSVLTIRMHDKSGARQRSARDAAGEACLFKPFSIEDATSRVRAVLRKGGVDHDAVRARVSVGNLVLDEELRQVWRDGENIALTPTEFALMRFFVRNPGRALSTREILGRVWHYDYTGQSSQVRLYVSYLRRRIDDGREPMIHTLRRTGYVFKSAQAVPQRAARS